MIIAIDGPAGAGKSTVARALAARLGIGYLDTGALYRATTLLSGDLGLPPERVAEELDISLGDRIIANGRDVTEAIRTSEVTRRTPGVAQLPDVRKALMHKQRDILHRGDWVAEGRDIGTVVAPDADVKIFLTASEEERARRRAAETGRPVDAVVAELRERDEQDTRRDHSPLVAAAGAVEVDTTSLDLDAVLDRIEAVVPDVPSAPRLFGLAPGQLSRRAASR